jgi:Flp pilus assembly pilin Flp
MGGAPHAPDTGIVGTANHLFSNPLENPLKSLFLNLSEKFRNLLAHEEGQDLVEYALLITLIALACVGGVRHVASAVNQTFSNISTTLS